VLTPTLVGVGAPRGDTGLQPISGANGTVNDDDYASINDGAPAIVYNTW